MLVNRRKDDSRYLAELTWHRCSMSTSRPSTGHAPRQQRSAQARAARQQPAPIIEAVVDSAPAAIVVLDHARQIRRQSQLQPPGRRTGEQSTPSQLVNLLEENLGGAIEALKLQGQAFTGKEVTFDLGGRTPRWFSCHGRAIRIEGEHADDFFDPGEENYLLLTVNDITALPAAAGFPAQRP